MEQEVSFVLCECRFVIRESLIRHSVPDDITDNDEDYDTNSPDKEEDSDESENEDTDIEEDEVRDLEKDTAVNMPPKRKVSPLSHLH